MLKVLKSILTNIKSWDDFNKEEYNIILTYDEGIPDIKVTFKVNLDDKYLHYEWVFYHMHYDLHQTSSKSIDISNEFKETLSEFQKFIFSQLLNEDYDEKLNLENIFFVGNRKLQDLIIYYNGIDININKLIQYFYLSNMYLIKNFKINNRELTKYSDLLNQTLEKTVNIIINDIYKYKFTNISEFGENIIRINFL